MNCCFFELWKFDSERCNLLTVFTIVLKDAIYYLDIPSRRLRLSKYSMHRKVLFSSYWIAQKQGSVLEVFSLSFVPVISGMRVRAES